MANFEVAEPEFNGVLITAENELVFHINLPGVGNA